MMFRVQALQKVSKLEAENQSIGQVGFHALNQLECVKPLNVFWTWFLQLKEQMMLLEAQLEKQTDSLVVSENMEQVHKQRQ